MGLWDRVSEKRKQKKKNQDQDNEITKLKEKIEQGKNDKDKGDSKRKGKSTGAKGKQDDDDELRDALNRSGALIRREFDEGYGKLGTRFAIGDCESIVPNSSGILTDSHQTSPRTNFKAKSSRSNKPSSKSSRTHVSTNGH